MIIICDEELCEFRHKERYLCTREKFLELEKNPDGAYNPICKSMVSTEEERAPKPRLTTGEQNDRMMRLEDRIERNAWHINGLEDMVDKLKDRLFDIALLLAKHADRKNHDPLFDEIIATYKPAMTRVEHGAAIGIDWDLD